MGIYPTPFRDRALQGEHFVVSSAEAKWQRDQRRNW